MHAGLKKFLIKFIALASVCAAVRSAVALGADEAALASVCAAAQSERTVSRILVFGFGAPSQKEDKGEKAEKAALPPEENSAPPLPPPEKENEAPEKPAEAAIETTVSPEGYSESGGILFKNETDYAIDAAALLSEKLSFPQEGKIPRVLIIHTHGSEAFTQSDGLYYDESDPWRTEEPTRSVIALGDEIAEVFEERGIPVLHDRGLYDYPSYAGSYDRAAESVRGYLEKYPDIGVVLDVHRDALMDGDTVYKTLAEVNGEKCAQVLVLSGTNFSGLEHPKWRENLKLAVRLQAEMNEKYPGLTRPITVSRYRYNQQLTSGSLIIEVGCNGNSLTEALAAAGYFADCAANVLEKAP